MKNLKKSILILSSLIIMVLCSACSKANNYSMSDFVGVYYGENGSVLTRLSNGTSNYYFVSSDNIETGSPWNYDDKKLTWHYQGGNLDVYAKISKDNNKMVFKSNNPLFWDNGEYVKIYLYLLRCLKSDSQELSIPLIADKFEHTETDVRRALKYWEKMKLLKLYNIQYSRQTSKM